VREHYIEHEDVFGAGFEYKPIEIYSERNAALTMIE